MRSFIWNLFLEQRVDVREGWISHIRQVAWGIPESIRAGLGECPGLKLDTSPVFGLTTVCVML